MKLRHIVIAASATLFGSAALAGGCDLANLSAWTSNQNPAGKLDVTAGAAMNGTSCGLAVETIAQAAGSDKHFVQDSSPSGETRYRAAFSLDLNGMTLPSSGSNRRIKVQQAQCSGCANTDVVQFKIQNNGGQYQLNTFVRDSNIGNTLNKSTVDISNTGCMRVEYDVDLVAGTYKVWLDATSEGETPVVDKSGLDMAAWPQITRARLGSMDKSNQVPVAQVFYVDEFESRRQTFIGGSCTP